MRTLEANSVDAIVTDPPYGIGFMGKAWDHGVPGKEFWFTGIELDPDYARIAEARIAAAVEQRRIETMQGDIFGEAA